MSTVNVVTDVTAAVAALNTIVTDANAVIAYNTNATGAPVVNTGNAGHVNACQAILKAAHAALQLLNDPRFQSGSAHDTNLTTG